MTVFSDTYDTNAPAGSDDPSDADNEIRRAKAATQERMNVDGYWPLTGTEVSDENAGEQRKLTIRTLTVDEVTALSATKAYLYRLVTDGELYFKDASDNTIKLTTGGKIDASALSEDSSITAAMLEGTLPDGADLAAATESGDSDRTIADKAFVDAKEDTLVTQATAGIFGSWTNLDSIGGTLVKDGIYRVGSDGFVVGYIVNQGESMKLYVEAGDATPDVQRMGVRGYAFANMGGFCCPIGKDEYWKITVSAGAVIIFWKSIGTGKCVKQ